MKFFVTGGTGFVGSHVLEQLVQRDGLQVAALVRSPVAAWRLAEMSPRLTVIEGDLSNPAAWRPALAAFAPTTVIHLAWAEVANHATSQQQQTNFTATMNLLDASRHCGVRHWIGLGSQAEYAPLNMQLDEDAPLEPASDYGRAKVAACSAARRFCKQHGLRFAWLRLFSTYGPRDNPQWLVPSTIAQLLAGQSPAVTAGEQLWDFVFVRDAAEAIVLTAICQDAQGVLNLGGGQAYQLRRVIEQIRDLIDPKLSIGFGAVPYRAGQRMHLEANIERLERATGWTPGTSLVAGLAETVDWHRRQHVAAPRAGFHSAA